MLDGNQIEAVLDTESGTIEVLMFEDGVRLGEVIFMLKRSEGFRLVSIPEFEYQVQKWSHGLLVCKDFRQLFPRAAQWGS